MNKILLLLTAACGSAWPQTTFTIDPPVIRRCTNGRGRATLRWLLPFGTQAQVRVGGFDGVPMTALEGSQGAATTLDWVDDGMIFALVDAAGVGLAQVRARVVCGGLTDPVLQALAASTYLPLETGFEWHYRSNNRFATTAYVTWRVTRGEIRSGQTWFVISVERSGRPDGELFFRVDADGRIFRIFDGPRLWIDPTPNPDPGARFPVQARLSSYVNALGSFPDAVQYAGFRDSLVREQGVLVRGVGFVSTTATLLTGSSGGFLESLELVEARLGDNLRFQLPDGAIEIDLESSLFDLGARQADNCAIPCYSVACFGADPPGTYKPCARARVRLRRLRDRNESGVSLPLELLDEAGRTVFSTRLAPPADAAEWVQFQQIPFFTAPSVPLPPGAYRLRATIEGAAGEQLGAAQTNIAIR